MSAVAKDVCQRLICDDDGLITDSIVALAALASADVPPQLKAGAKSRQRIQKPQNVNVEIWDETLRFYSLAHP